MFALSRHINDSAGRELIPEAIIQKPPSAELAPEQKDEDSLPPYAVLDEILKILIEGQRLSSQEYDAARLFVDKLMQTEAGRQTVDKVQRMVHRSEYKRRQAPPSCGCAHAPLAPAGKCRLLPTTLERKGRRPAALGTLNRNKACPQRIIPSQHPRWHQDTET